ncbi:MAG: aminoglycoside phosphotransferase family protein [bacterium]
MIEFEALNCLLDRSIGKQALTVTPLACDASSRSYYRIQLDGGAKTAVACKYEPEMADQIPQFTRVADWLVACEIPVPEIIGFDQSKGLVLLEDLGDNQLFSKVKMFGEIGVQDYYKEALDQLLLLQLQPVDKKLFPLKLDKEKFFWELSFFLEHTERLYGSSLKLSPSIKKRLNDQFERLAQILDEEPEMIVHRDFHSKNLMVVDPEKSEEKQGLVYWIDFQDARRGLCQYDLVSLLRDSYVVLENYHHYLNYFLDRRQQFTGEIINREDFISVFKLASIQRNLKAVGTFTSQANLYGNRSYLAYVKPTLNYVKQSLRRNPDCQELSALLTGSGILSL